MEGSFCFLGCLLARGKRVWVLGKLEGASGFCDWLVSEVQLGDVPKPLICGGGVREPSPFPAPPLTGLT